MKKFFLILTAGILVLCAFETVKTVTFTVPKNWPATNYDFKKNPLTAEKIELGRALFYDPILSRNNAISCSSCHLQFTAFTHVDHGLSHGIDDRIGTRNSPALMNLAWHKLFMWDGAVNHIEVQALAPISNPLEMDEKVERVVNKLQRSKIYPALFAKAYGDTTITGERTLKAMAQFMLTLVSCNAKYDSVINKQAKFTAQEEKGYKLFQKNCSACHKEPLFTNQKFENNGLPVDKTLNDIGRMKVTKNPADSLKFKVPSLRNIEFSQPYMHDGRFKRISDVLNHYTRGISKSKTLSDQLVTPIVLSSTDKVDLTAFLLTLTDKKFLFNKDYMYPKHIFMTKAQD